MFDFAFADLCLNFLNQKQRCRIRPVIIQIQRKIHQHQQQQCVSHRWSNILFLFIHRMEFDFFFILKPSTNPPENIILPRRIFTNGLLELQRLDKIKFFVALCKTYIADTRLLKMKGWSVFWCKSAKKEVSLLLKPFAHLDIIK